MKILQLFVIVTSISSKPTQNNVCKMMIFDPKEHLCLKDVFRTLNHVDFMFSPINKESHEIWKWKKMSIIYLETLNFEWGQKVIGGLIYMFYLKRVKSHIYSFWVPGLCERLLVFIFVPSFLFWALTLLETIEVWGVCTSAECVETSPRCVSVAEPPPFF